MVSANVEVCAPNMMIFSSEDIVDVVSGYSSRAPAHTQLIVIRDDRLDPQTGKKTSYSGMVIVIANKVFPIQKK
jgi:hypothetical protein